MFTNNRWDELLEDEFSSESFALLQSFIKDEYEKHTVYPPKEDIFNALRLTDFDDVKVVILGQDPYHGAGQAHGLAFSVPKGCKIPPSLLNIFKELNAETLKPVPKSGDLTEWAKNGVLLLNCILTVREGQPLSHAGAGWEKLTDKIISLLGKREKPCVFMLWGNFAKSKESLIENKNHLILTAAHPSPLSAYRGFFGCGHFTAARDFLLKNS